MQNPKETGEGSNDQPPMTKGERFVRDNLRLEGLEVSDDLAHDMRDIIEGNIPDEEVIERIKRRWQQ